jgi:hypothetical protein
MTNKNKIILESIQDTLKSHLDESEKMWTDDEKSEAFIVGYLQGTIKVVIGFINSELNK